MSLDITLTQDGQEVYGSNITHNLGRMAREAGIYEALWMPEEIGAVKASNIIDKLQEGLDRLVASPSLYSQYNSPNGWGTWEAFVPFVSRYLEACRSFPDALIEVSV